MTIQPNHFEDQMNLMTNVFKGQDDSKSNRKGLLLVLFFQSRLFWWELMSVGNIGFKVSGLFIM